MLITLVVTMKQPSIISKLQRSCNLVSMLLILLRVSRCAYGLLLV